MDMHTSTDVYTHSNQGVGTKVECFKGDLHLELGSALEVGPPFRGWTSNWRWDLQLEV